ncbi:hypothetical protein AVEN_128586-1 [Araneus ventricosus]|uniref:Uncharacterized protein n=1 Tax=Araneus ventricosus TaxID=182803 RepID=A0A4Y2K9V1_ARAVE|nr:hypothetical protein AVEN_128586-1 [Araneus ventricosus]
MDLERTVAYNQSYSIQPQHADETGMTLPPRPLRRKHSNILNKKNPTLLRLKLSEFWSFEFHDFSPIRGLVEEVLCIDWWIVFKTAIEMV